ncbi:Kelch repeat-containing protein, partial [Chloroflexus sp.]|uniref:Kelch repeat-containing protein n=1 Tax=Chloroflexus sp. TaxID=1904827 RepID=UPI002ACE20EA
MRPDCGDIRFTDSDGVTLLSHYVFDNRTNYVGLSYSWSVLGCGTNRTHIRVRVTNIQPNSNKIIYMYFGNPAASFVNNPNNVFSDGIRVMSATLPSARYSLSCAPHGDSIYCFGGYDGSGRLNQIIRYNVTSDTVTIMSATLPSARYGLSCAPMGDSIYCFGGYNGTYLNQIIRYNVTSDTVTIMSATLPSGKYYLSCAPHGDSIYCFAGLNGDRNQIVRYNVTSNTVTIMSATLPLQTYDLSCAPHGDSIYCFGGVSSNQIVRYNVTSDTVTVVSTLPTARYGLSCAPHGDSIYCFGGSDPSDLNQIIRYNVTSNTVTIMSATLPSARSRLSCAPHGDSIYCFGGTGGGNQIVRYGLRFTSPEPFFVRNESLLVNNERFRFIENTTASPIILNFQNTGLIVENLTLITINFSANLTISNQNIHLISHLELVPTPNTFVTRSIAMRINLTLRDVMTNNLYNYLFNYTLTLEIYNFNLFSCTTPNTLRILVLNEETLTNINFNITFMLIRYSSNITKFFNITNVFNLANYSLCIYPSW